jgi:polyhydroxyalkanoate synthesis regulator phasin
VARGRQIMEAAFPEIALVLIAAAKEGDIAAGRIVAERVVPVARSAPIRKPVDLTGDAATRAVKVADMMAAGELSLEEGEKLLDAIDTAIRVCREMHQFRRSEEFLNAILEEIRAESPECEERIVRRIAGLQRERGLTLDVKAEDAPALAPKGEASDDVF